MKLPIMKFSPASIPDLSPNTNKITKKQTYQHKWLEHLGKKCLKTEHRSSPSTQTQGQKIPRPSDKKMNSF